MSLMLGEYRPTGLSLVAEGQYGKLQIDAAGSLKVVSIGEVGGTMVSKQVAIVANKTAEPVWTPAAGKKFVLVRLVVSATAAGTVKFFDNTDSATTAVAPVLSLAANQAIEMKWELSFPYRSAAADNVLKYTSDASIAGSVYVEGYEE